MEYQFTHTMHGVIARCSMDHEAFARWLNSEIVESNPSVLTSILNEIVQCKSAYPNQYEFIFEGKEYSLYISSDEVMVKANHLTEDFAEEIFEEGLQYYDQESIAFCGLEDFEAFLNAYQKFLKTYH